MSINTSLRYWLDQVLNHGPLNAEDYKSAKKALIEATISDQPVGLPNESEIEHLAVSRIATWLWQKCNPELPQTSENLDLLQAQARELWRLIRHYPDGDAGCEPARADLSSETSTLTMPAGSNPRTSRAPTEETCNISELTCAKDTKTAFGAPGMDWDVLQAWSRVQHAMKYYASVSLYSLKSSGVPGGIATYNEVGYLATNCGGDVKTVDKFVRSTMRESFNPMLMAALKDAVHFIRNRHNTGRGVREENRLAVLANAQEVLSQIEENARRGPDAE